MVNPKFLKKKTTDKTVSLSARYRKEVHDFLIQRGINLTAVCREALEAELKSPKEPSKRADQYTHVFRIPGDLGKRVKSSGINVHKTCRDALEAVFEELKAEEAKARRTK